ncbi:protein of unknown function [Cupriavidus taiwanensis]|uniref:Uncharacterized protein n=1 Tax=Cupriavidus taiwanensis TaxID=164546 RepID=A0A9Q7UWM8_9BURK|nr:protein of unknown function [Cupriavidus taiwanensis]
MAQAWNSWLPIYDHNYHDYERRVSFSYAGIPRQQAGRAGSKHRKSGQGRAKAADIHAVRVPDYERNPSIQPMGLERRLAVAYTCRIQPS